MPTPPIVLASSSPYRRDILARLGLEFETRSPDIDETPRAGESAGELAARLSLEKARAVAGRTPGALVIGSDQAGELDGDIIGKPADREDALRILARCSGAAMTLYSGVALLDSRGGAFEVEVDTFEVTYRNFDRQTARRYLDAARPYDCCGALRAEGVGVALLRALSGTDPNTLVGLPLIRLAGMLERAGVRLV